MVDLLPDDLMIAYLHVSVSFNYPSMWVKMGSCILLRDLVELDKVSLNACIPIALLCRHWAVKRHRTPLQGWRSAVSDPRRTARVQLGLSGTTEVAGCCIIADNRVGTDRLALALGQREKGRR